MTLFPTIENIILAPGGDVTVDVHAVGTGIKKIPQDVFITGLHMRTPHSAMSHTYMGSVLDLLMLL